MKKLIWLAALFALPASANCLNDRFGQPACGPGPCIEDRYGEVYCAK